MPVSVETIDRRTIKIMFPATPEDVIQALEGVRQEGYDVTGGSTLMGGDQRDPYPVGLNMIVTRTNKR